MQVSNSVGLYVPSGGAYPSVHFRQNRGKNQKPETAWSSGVGGGGGLLFRSLPHWSMLGFRCHSNHFRTGSHVSDGFDKKKKNSYMAYLDVLLHEGTVLLRHDLILTWQNVPWKAKARLDHLLFTFWPRYQVLRWTQAAHSPTWRHHHVSPANSIALQRLVSLRLNLCFPFLTLCQCKICLEGMNNGHREEMVETRINQSSNFTQTRLGSLLREGPKTMAWQGEKSVDH